MKKLAPEMERVMASLRARLNKKSDVDDSPLWNVVAAHLNATLISVEDGFRGERIFERQWRSWGNTTGLEGGKTGYGGAVDARW